MILPMQQSSNVAEEKPEMVSSNVRFSEELWRRAKVAAAQHGKTLQQLCNEGLELRLNQLAKEKR